MRTSNVKFLKGGLEELPVTWLGLPGSSLYFPPKVFTTTRAGSEVTITWQPIWMTEDDYRGYLIEAWVCQGGKQVFLPVSYVPALESNTGMLSVTITDEPGCDQPSRGWIYSADKYGYSTGQILFWPPN